MMQTTRKQVAEYLHGVYQLIIFIFILKENSLETINWFKKFWIGICFVVPFAWFSTT